MASVGSDRRVIVWHAATGEELRRVALPSLQTVVRVFPDGARIATGIGDEQVDPALIWDIDSARLLHRL